MNPCTANRTGTPSLRMTVEGVTSDCKETVCAVSRGRETELAKQCHRSQRVHDLREFRSHKRENHPTPVNCPWFPSRLPKFRQIASKSLSPCSLADIHGKSPGHPHPGRLISMTGATSIAIGLPEHSRSWRGLPFLAKAVYWADRPWRPGNAGLRRNSPDQQQHCGIHLLPGYCGPGIAAESKPARNHRNVCR